MKSHVREDDPFEPDPDHKLSLAYRKRMGSSRGPIRIIRCRVCKQHPLVGYGDYHIALRCERCGWEICGSDG